MPSRIEAHETISLNGVEYPLKEGTRVRHVLASQYAPKVVIGDTSRDSLQRASVLNWLEWRDGIGLEQIENSGDTARAWWSTLQLRFKKHLVLAALATQTAASGVAGVFDVVIGERADEIYGAFGTAVRRYNNATDSWGSTLFTLPASATSSANVVMGGTEYLIFATGGGYTYYDGTTATDDSSLATNFLVFWDDRLWGIDDQGQLWFAVTIGTEVSDALLPVTADTVTGMFVGRAATGELIIFVSTTRGLFAHDVDNARFVETELALPFHPDNGKGATRWRDASYISSGLGVYKYVNGANAAVVTVVGPDRDHGVPANRRGAIRQFITSHNELMALVDATTAPSALSLFTGNSTTGTATVLGSSPVVEANTGFSWIGGFDERGWQVVWLSPDQTSAITSALVSNAYDSYRLWFAQNLRVHWIQLQRDIINPNENTTFTYAASGTHETPWFDGGQIEVDKLALRLRVEVEDASANEHVTVYFATNGSTSWTQLTDTYTADSTFNAGNDRIQGAGVTTFSFPSVTAPRGTAFRSIRFRLDLARGSTTTNTPDVISVTLEWRKKIPAQWGHLVTIDLNRLAELEGESSGRTREELFDTIRTAVESNELVEFTFRNRAANDSGTANPYNYRGDIVQVTGLEQTGEDWGSEIQLTVVEV